VLLALVALLLAGAAWSVWPVRSVQAHSARIAVLPFAFHGSKEYEYLGAGMVDLLSANLDGVAGLRSVDPRALLALSAQGNGQPIDPKRARSVAARFGAGHVVLGGISEANGRLRISASLYENDGAGEPVANVVVEGDATDLFVLIDRLTKRLLAEGPMRGGTRLDGLAALTTSSMPALKAYLAGMGLLRQGSFEAAVDVFEHATAEDSTFALAHYRLALAAAWAKRFDLTRLSAARAVEHGDRLSRRDRLLLEGVLAYYDGRPDDAEASFRDLLGAYPDEVEGWLQLGEVLYHYNPLRGRPIEESLPAWERALELEPNNRFAHAHIAFIAADQGDTASLRRARNALAAGNDRDALALTAALLDALATGDRADEARVVAQLRQASPAVVTEAVWTTISLSRNRAGVDRIVVLLDTPDRPPERFAADRLRLAHLHMGRGRWRDGVAQLMALESKDPVAALLHHALLAGLEFSPARLDEVHAVRKRLEAWDPSGASGSGYYPTEDFAPFRLYLLGLLGIRLGELEAAETRAEELARLPRVADPVLARDLSLSLRAQAARARGDLEVALGLLEQVRGTGTVYNRAMGSPIRGRSYERYLRADLLRQLGRHEEALRWYAVLGTLSPLEAVYTAPVSLGLAQVQREGR
jgi:tetratricopeptide (TPR) repeat protein